MIEINQQIYDEMRSALLSIMPECGGVLGAKQGQPVSKFYFDVSGVSTRNAYIPDHVAINSILEQWEQENIIMVGIAHSHAGENTTPSCGDLFYCERILQANPGLHQFLLPIMSCKSKELQLYVCMLKDGHIHVIRDDWKIV